MLFSTILIAASMMLSDTLAFSSITAEKGIAVSRRDTVSVNGYMRAEEALMRIPGLLINDMGGASGLKTASLRGLGTAQTAIYIDGVRTGNLMNGQNDLSMFSLGNFSTVTVDYAQNSISFSTAAPTFMSDRRYSIRAGLESGSFGTYRPDVSVGYRISDKVTAGINAAGLSSKGHREHSRMGIFSGGLDFMGIMNLGEWKAKGYVNASDRECPGSAASPWLSDQKDLNGFLQGSINKRFGQNYTLNASTKISIDRMEYKDDYSEDSYLQTEIQLNTSHLFRLKEWCTLSFSASGKWDGLKADNYICSEKDGTPLMISRFSVTTVAGASFRTPRFRSDINMEYAGALDLGFEENRKMTDSRHCISPAASLRFTAFEGFDITAFGRRAYHIPTFNDLYYTGSGNRALKPEDAWLTDIGIDWQHIVGRSWTLTAKADGFFNYLKDKITWAPSTDNPSIWLPYNIGKVRSVGADICLSAGYRKREWKAFMSARYSYQDARDRTPGAYAFDSQIAYIARHTAVLCGNVEYKGWRLEAIWNWRDGRKDAGGDMPSWNTLDIKADKSMMIRDICEITFSIKARNVTDNRYEITSGYPMPGWGLYGGLTLRL